MQQVLSGPRLPASESLAVSRVSSRYEHTTLATLLAFLVSFSFQVKKFLSCLAREAVVAPDTCDDVSLEIIDGHIYKCRSTCTVQLRQVRIDP